MRLSSFEIRRFRSFDKSVIIPLSDLSVLIGPNNLGKSTVLNALGVFFGSFHRAQFGNRFDRLPRFNQESDYPAKYVGKPGRHWPTRMKATFELTQKERQAARKEVGRVVPSQIALQVEFSTDDFGRIRPKFTSPWSKSENKISALLAWIANNLRYVYIPATRNISDFRRSVFTELVGDTIQKLSRNKRRIETIEKFYSEVKNNVKTIEENIVQELKAYVPDVRQVDFVFEDLDLLRLVSLSDVRVDDGANTSLSNKGDGFKSLFALSLLQYIAQQQFSTGIIFGIEEPEAHLHTEAMYSVKATLRALSRRYQVVLTSHSPVLVQRDNLSHNIVIDRMPGNDFAATAYVARNLAHIRKCLGIRPQDNLTTAEVVIIVEGPTEETSLLALLGQAETSIRPAIESGRIRIISAGGASKVIPLLRALARDATSCIVALDSDAEGTKEFQNVCASGLIEVRDAFRVPPRRGCSETEYEDLFDPSIYIQAVASSLGIPLDLATFTRERRASGGAKTRMKKWSDVLTDICSARGKDWSLLSDEAKTAFGVAIRDNVSRVNEEALLWASAIARQATLHLTEK